MYRLDLAGVSEWNRAPQFSFPLGSARGLAVGRGITCWGKVAGEGLGCRGIASSVAPLRGVFAGLSLPLTKYDTFVQYSFGGLAGDE
jgi:hypothetical protein